MHVAKERCRVCTMRFALLLIPLNALPRWMRRQRRKRGEGTGKWPGNAWAVNFSLKIWELSRKNRKLRSSKLPLDSWRFFSSSSHGDRVPCVDCCCRRRRRRQNRHRRISSSRRHRRRCCCCFDAREVVTCGAVYLLYFFKWFSSTADTHACQPHPSTSPAPFAALFSRPKPRGGWCHVANGKAKVTVQLHRQWAATGAEAQWRRPLRGWGGAGGTRVLNTLQRPKQSWLRCLRCLK